MLSLGKLTKAQITELKRLAREPQPTFGRARARVQNNLYYKFHLVRFLDMDGNVLALHVYGLNAGADRCEITCTAKDGADLDSLLLEMVHAAGREAARLLARDVPALAKEGS